MSSASLPRRRILIAFCCMCLLYFFSYFQRMALPGTVFNELQADFQASASAITALGAIFLYVYGAMQIFTGMLADRFGGARVLLIGGAMLSIGSLVSPLAPSIAWLYAARALTGLGASLIFISIVKELDANFPARYFAMILCVMLFIGYAGGLAGTMPMARVTELFGWRPPMLTAGTICCLVWLVTWYFLGGRPAANRLAVRLNPLRQLRIVITNPDTYPIVTFGAINFSIYFFLAGRARQKISD